MSLTLEEGMRAELIAVSGLNNKVYPLQTNQTNSVPYLIYANAYDARERDLISYQNVGLVEANIEINIYHSTYASLKALMSLVIAEIKTWERTNVGVTGPYIQQVEFGESTGKTMYEDAVSLQRGIIEITLSYNEN